MAKVYLSSTLADLKAERQAAIDWLLAAGHQPVHSYRPDSDSVSLSCLDDIAGCDACVLILGHRYGHVPEHDNPQQRSITHLEFAHAGALGLPRVALLRTSVPDARLSDLTDPQRAAAVLAFRAEVERSVRVAEFADLQGLIQGLSTGVQTALAEARRLAQAPARTHTPGGSSPPASPLPPPPPPVPTVSEAARSGSWWATLPGILTAVGGLVAAVTGLVGALQSGGWIGRGTAPSPPPPTATTGAAPVPGPAPASPAALAPPSAPRIELAGPQELSFRQPSQATYTVLSADTRPLRPGVVELRLRVRALNQDRYDLNFWDATFRLLIDDLPRAPVSNLNELVAGMSSKDGEVVFEVPTDARSLALQVIHHAGEKAIGTLPLRWQR